MRPTGGGFNDGKVFADPGVLLVEPGNSLEGLSWEQPVRAAEDPGYIDV